MSTATTPSAPIDAQLNTGNKFDFSTHSGNINITYYPTAPGPIVVGELQGSLFIYDGPEGELSFRGSEVSKQETPVGSMLSVVLKPNGPAGSGSITFALFLPSVAIGSDKSQTFTTYAVKATDVTPSLLLPGSRLQYEVERLKGDAQDVTLPFVATA
jgi:hypothetical protein